MKTLSLYNDLKKQKNNAIIRLKLRKLKREYVHTKINKTGKNKTL